MRRAFRPGWSIARFLSFSVLLLLFVACDRNVAIINGIDERDANEIVVYLTSKGIPAEKQAATVSTAMGAGAQKQLWNIGVDPSQTTEAMALLNSIGLPRREGQSLLDLFANPGLVPTEMQQKIRYEAGLAEQISNTIRQIDGVIDANVQLSFPPEGSNQPISASVYVKHNGILDNPNSQLVTKIKQLVAGSVTGLSLDNVTVVADRARFTDVTLDQGSLANQNPEHEYVRIWSVIVAKDSVGTFRSIFFTFSLVIFVLVCLIAWLIWKLYPIILHFGGVSTLWEGLRPLDMSKLHENELLENEPEKEKKTTPPQTKEKK